MAAVQTQPLFTNFTDAWPAANGPDGGFTIDGEQEVGVTGC